MGKEIRWLLEEKYHGQETKAFKKDLKRLKRGEPLDYIIGFTEFLGCKIDLSKRPLIPRPETEFWVQRAIEELKMKSGKLNVLDIFAGSGCVGIAILKHVPNVTVTFAEKDNNCLLQIKINLRLNNIDSKRGRIVESNIFSNVEGKFDYILANPPYIPTTRKHKVQTSVSKYEPQRALFAGSEGLIFINRFLKEAEKYLQKNGTIYMEFDSWQKKKIETLLKKLQYQEFEFFKDQYGKQRYLVIKYK